MEEEPGGEVENEAEETLGGNECSDWAIFLRAAWLIDDK